MDLIDRPYSEDTKQEVDDFQLDKVESSGDEWFAYTSETITITYQSGESETNEYNWKYTVHQEADSVIRIIVMIVPLALKV